MSLGIGLVESAAARRALYAFRYRVYVEELGLTTAADHERRLLFDDLDEYAHSYAVTEDGEVLGSLRVIRLAELPDPAPLVEKFSMQPALARFGAQAIVTTSRFILDPRLRLGTTIFHLMQAAFRDCAAYGARLNYGDCSPHLLGFYEFLGYRRYTAGFNDTAYGFKIPILMLAGDRAYFDAVRSPLRRAVHELDDDAEARAWFAGTYPAYSSPLGAAFADETHFFDLLAERVADDPRHGVALLRGLTREEAAHFLRRANLVSLGAGDLIVRKGDRDETLYVLLSGAAEVPASAPDGPPIAVFGAGDTFGEIGFLTGSPRSADVVARAASEVLILDSDFLQRVIVDEPAIGARVMFNLSRELAGRLAVTTARYAGGDVS